MFQGFSNFSDFLHYFVGAKLATTSIRVNHLSCKNCFYFQSFADSSEIIESNPLSMCSYIAGPIIKARPIQF